MFIKSKPKQIVLLDKELDLHVRKEELLEVILSPALYWVKKFDIPLKSPKKAQQLLPSLFEEFLPDGEYNYFGYFEDDVFFGFAYDKRVILALLAEKGIELPQVSSFYFAQSEFSEDLLPYKLDKNRALIMQEGIVIIMPKEFVQETKKIDIRYLALSDHKIKNFEYYNNYFDKKMLSLIVGIFVIMILLDGIAWYKTSKESKKFLDEKEKIFTTYKLLPTTIQNISLLKKYEKLYKKEKGLQNFFKLLFQVKLPEGVVLKDISYKRNVVRIVFLHVNKPEDILKQFSSLHIRKKYFTKNQLWLDIEV